MACTIVMVCAYPYFDADPIPICMLTCKPCTAAVAEALEIGLKAGNCLLLAPIDATDVDVNLPPKADKARVDKQVIQHILKQQKVMSRNSANSP
jgi:hypothetical protein